MDQALSKIQELATDYGLQLAAAVILLIVGRFAAKLIANVIQRVMKQANVDDMLVSFVGTMTYITVMTFVIVAVLGQLGVETATLIAVVGAASLAIGLALQGGLANFSAGFLMVVFRPFTVGDRIEAAGVEGIVEQFALFTTQIGTDDGHTVIVPNAKITEGNITNFTTKGMRRIEVIAPISYLDDVERAKNLVETVLAENKEVLREPSAEIGVLSLGSRGVDLAVRIWVRIEDVWTVHFAVLEQIRKRFDSAGIRFPIQHESVLQVEDSHEN